MRRKVLIGAAAAIFFMLGMGIAVASDYSSSDGVVQSTYQRSPDCKYPPCD